MWGRNKILGFELNKKLTKLTKQKGGRPTHRDNLKEDLLEAGLSLIQELGIENVGFREIAHKTGVSHNAPLYHFHTKQDFFTSMAIISYKKLNQILIEKYELSKNPIDRIYRMGLGYVEFCLGFDSHFQAMSNSNLKNDDEELILSKQSAFLTLKKAVLEAQETGWRKNKDTQMVALYLWSVVHGFSVLWKSSSFSSILFQKNIDEIAKSLADEILGR